MTLPLASEVAERFEKEFGQEATVLFDSSVGGSPAGFPRGKDVRGLTILRWLSRPAIAAPRLLGLENGEASALLQHLGAAAESGAVILAAAEAGAGASPAPEQLRRLGLEVVRGTPVEEGQALAGQGELAGLLRFAVVPSAEAPGSPDPEDPPPPDMDSVPLDIYSSTFIGLAGELGAPLEAIWHIRWEASGLGWCLFNTGVEGEEAARIPYRTALDAERFVAALRSLSEYNRIFLDLPVYVALGPGHGHAIHIDRFEGDTVVYHDPWPGRSLLAAGNNERGLEARPAPEPDRWLIAAGALAEVAHASIVHPAIWLSLRGEKVTLPYEELAASDFFTFFNISETGRNDSDEDGSTRIELSPGAWHESIDLSLTAEPNGEVRGAMLAVERGWLSSPETAPFAIDLLKSFLAAMVTPFDLAEARQLIEGIAAMATGTEIAVLAGGPPHLLDQMRSIVLVTAGESAFGRLCLPCSTIRAINSGNEDGGDRAKLHLRVERPLFQLGPLFEDRQTGYMMDEYRESLWRRVIRDGQRLGWIGPEHDPA